MTVKVQPVPRTLVTGGTRGIGAAVVRRLARAGAEGHELVALGREPRTPSWAAALGEHAAAVRFDGAECADLEATRAAAARGDADGAGYTGLVASAGIWIPSPVEAEPGDVLRAHERVLDVNLLGTVRAVVAFLERQRRGVPCSIVLVGSTAGQRGESLHGAYAASKAALMGLAKSWAVELAPRLVRVNVCAPGWVDTEMTAGELANAARRGEIERAIPRGRIATAEDLAGPVAFLLSDDSAHVTGTVLSVNGGGVLASY